MNSRSLTPTHSSLSRQNSSSSAKCEEFKYQKLDHPCRPADKCSHPDIVEGEGFGRTPGAPLIGHRHPGMPSDWSSASWPVIGCSRPEIPSDWLLGAQAPGLRAAERTLTPGPRGNAASHGP